MIAASPDPDDDYDTDCSKVDSDVQLLRRYVTSGDIASFELLVQRHAPAVFSVCRRYLKNDAAVDDAVQTTFFVLVRKAPEIAEPEKLGGWLYAVAENTAKETLRKNCERCDRERRATTANSEDVVEVVTARELGAILDEEISRLPPKLRRAVVLCRLNGIDIEEAAVTLKCSSNCVSVRLNRACELLQEKLRRRGIEIVTFDKSKRPKEIAKIFEQALHEYYVTNNMKKAEKGFRAVLAQAGGAVDLKRNALRYLAGSVGNQGRNADAIELENRWLKLYPNDPSRDLSLFFKGVYLSRKGDLAEAKACWEEILNKHPDSELTPHAQRQLKIANTAAVCFPAHWFGGGDGYAIDIDRMALHEGRPSASIQSIVPNPPNFASLGQVFAAGAYLGKRLRMTAYVKSRDVEGWAGLWMRIDGKKRYALNFDNMKERAITGTTDWKQYEIVLDVPRADSAEIYFGILLAGKGQVWVEGFRFESVGTDVNTTYENKMSVAREHPLVPNLPKQPRNLNFEE